MYRASKTAPSFQRFDIYFTIYHAIQQSGAQSERLIKLMEKQLAKRGSIFRTRDAFCQISLIKSNSAWRIARSKQIYRTYPQADLLLR